MISSARKQPVTVTLTSDEWGMVQAALYAAAQTREEMAADPSRHAEGIINDRESAAKLRAIYHSVNKQHHAGIGAA